jgi:Glyoxalase-like domain
MPPRRAPDEAGHGRRWWRGGWPGTLVSMAVSLHHVVIDAHDLPAMARFWAQVLGWRILSEHEQEIVIGADAIAPVGICFMPVIDAKTTKNRLHLDLSPDPASRRPRSSASLRLVPGGWTSGRPAPSRGPSSPTVRATSSACVPSGLSSTRTVPGRSPRGSHVMAVVATGLTVAAAALRQ